MSGKGNIPASQITVREMVRKIEDEDKPAKTSKQKTARKIRTPRKLQAGNGAQENKKIPQYAASPGKILRGGGSVQKPLKTGSPLLPGKRISKLQKSKLITSNMGRGYFEIFQTKPVVVENGATSQKCDGPIGLQNMDGQGNTGNRLDYTKREENF